MKLRRADVDLGQVPFDSHEAFSSLRLKGDVLCLVSHLPDVSLKNYLLCAPSNHVFGFMPSALPGLGEWISSIHEDIRTATNLKKALKRASVTQAKVPTGFLALEPEGVRFGDRAFDLSPFWYRSFVAPDEIATEEVMGYLFAWIRELGSYSVLPYADCRVMAGDVGEYPTRDCESREALLFSHGGFARDPKTFSLSTAGAVLNAIESELASIERNEGIRWGEISPAFIYAGSLSFPRYTMVVASPEQTEFLKRVALRRAKLVGRLCWPLFFFQARQFSRHLCAPKAISERDNALQEICAELEVYARESVAKSPVLDAEKVSYRNVSIP